MWLTANTCTVSAPHGQNYPPNTQQQFHIIIYTYMTTGDKIPEILGRDQNGNEIKSSDYRGKKIVLYRSPKTNTP